MEFEPRETDRYDRSRAGSDHVRGRMTMRCEEVIAGLAAPDGPDSPALAEHLERCPRCAARARLDARLQRLWEVTRPEEPAPSTWATVWAQVTQALDATAAPTLAPPPRLLPTATP